MIPYVGWGANISEDGLYRYSLVRAWDVGPCVCWIMLNPSTADATEDDPTIRRCIGFAKSWGYSQIVVVNLFALRATDPRVLRWSPDPVGPLNDGFVSAHAADAELVVAAWGASWPPPLASRAATVMAMLQSMGTVHHLGLTKSGQPKHPLYLSQETKLQEWH